MLREFQQAFADLVASPALCREVRVQPERLLDRYHLTDTEYARLVGLARHRGMECTCMLYRANRLAPLAMNVPRLCQALGARLTQLLDEYWAMYPNSNVHFLWESYRFCRFVEEKLASGRDVPCAASSALAAEMPLLWMRIDASYTVNA